MRANCLVMASLVGLLFLGLGALPQQIAEHPALKPAEGDAGIDFGACLACHADKQSGAVVHPALELGCESCHEVEQEESETQVFLVAEGNELCFACHTEKEPAPSQLSLHAPVRREPCTVCHDSHASPNESLLRLGTESREPAENLCLGCHANIVAQIQKPIEHGAVDLGCSVCHLTHKSEPEDAPEGVFHLTQAPPELCLDCHDVEEVTLAEAHLQQPFAGSRCPECHNPHGSSRAKLINNFVHSPFEEKACDTCHEAPQEGQLAFVEGARRDLCLFCHAEKQELLEQSPFVHSALLVGGCVDCHSPHAATNSHQL
ncbi:MAG: cytochrome c3 family protein, partial [Terriglobia bacterium]